jgi:hypothetical protein
MLILLFSVMPVNLRTSHRLPPFSTNPQCRGRTLPKLQVFLLRAILWHRLRSCEWGWHTGPRWLFWWVCDLRVGRTYVFWSIWCSVRTHRRWWVGRGGRFLQQWALWGRSSRWQLAIVPLYRSRTQSSWIAQFSNGATLAIRATPCEAGYFWEAKVSWECDRWGTIRRWWQRLRLPIVTFCFTTALYIMGEQSQRRQNSRLLR